MAGEPRVGGPVESMLRSRMETKLSPVHIALVNESHLHSVPRGSESHFKLLVVSHAFEGKSMIERHRMVQQAVADEGGVLPVHALSISAKTPAQWEPGAPLHSTPSCLGGSKGDAHAKIGHA